MRSRRGLSHNQYRTGPTVSKRVPAVSLPMAGVISPSPAPPPTVKCKDIWGASCSEPISSPTWMHDAPVGHFDYARIRTCPPRQLRRLLTTNNDTLLIAIAGNPHCPKDLLLTFTAQYSAPPHSVVHRLFVSALKNPNYPRDRLEHWYQLLRYRTDQADVLASIFHNPACPAHIYFQAAEEPHIDHLYPAYIELVSNPACPPEVLSKLALHPPLARYIAANPRCSSHTIMYLYEHSDDPTIQLLIAAHHQTPPEVLAALSDHVNPNIQCAVASNPNTSLAVLGQLIPKVNLPTRKAVAARPDCPPDILEYLSRDTNHQVQQAVLSNPNCPLSISAFSALVSPRIVHDTT